MFLFSRTANLRGDERHAMTWAAEMTAHVDAHSDHEVTCWRASFGHPVGTVSWTCWSESQTALEAGFAGLATDDGYFEKVAAAGDMIASPPEDRLRRLLHGERASTPPPIGAVSTVTTAIMANGRYEKAMGWGVEMATFVEKLTHLPTYFLLDSYGTFGAVTWIVGAPDLASADAAGDLLDSNHDYLKRIDEAEKLFVPGSGRRAMFARIA